MCFSFFRSVSVRDVPRHPGNDMRPGAFTSTFETTDAHLYFSIGHGVIVKDCRAGTPRASVASEPRERSEPAKRRARERVGESEGRSPSDELAEMRANSVDELGALLAEAHPARNDHPNLGPGTRRGHNGQFRTDTGSAFAHATKAEMTVFPFLRNCRVDSDSIVGDTENQVTGVGEADLEPAAARVHGGVANGLIPDP